MWLSKTGFVIYKDNYKKNIIVIFPPNYRNATESHSRTNPHNRLRTCVVENNFFSSVKLCVILYFGSQIFVAWVFIFCRSSYGYKKEEETTSIMTVALCKSQLVRKLCLCCLCEEGDVEVNGLMSKGVKEDRVEVID